MSLAAHENALRPAPLGRTRRLLVVEDEPVLREMFAEILDPEGCVDTAEDGLEALACIEERDYQLVLTEVSLPRLDGLELFEEVVAAHPEWASRFVFISGGLSDESARFFESEGLRPLLRKPISVRTLITAVRERLAALADVEPAARGPSAATS